MKFSQKENHKILSNDPLIRAVNSPALRGSLPPIHSFCLPPQIFLPSSIQNLPNHKCINVSRLITIFLKLFSFFLK